MPAKIANRSHLRLGPEHCPTRHVRSVSNSTTCVDRRPGLGSHLTRHPLSTSRLPRGTRVTWKRHGIQPSTSKTKHDKSQCNGEVSRCSLSDVDCNFCPSSQAFTSSMSYRTERPTLTNFGPCPCTRHRSSVRIDTPPRCSESCF